MMWKKPPEIISRRTAERDQFLTPYSVRLPKARFTDARLVGVPVIPVETKPIPAPAGPLYAPAPHTSGVLPSPGALETVKVESKPSAWSRLVSKLMSPWFG